LHENIARILEANITARNTREIVTSCYVFQSLISAYLLKYIGNYEWLGFLEAYRTLCLAPTAELRVTFEHIRQGEVMPGKAMIEDASRSPVVARSKADLRSNKTRFTANL